MSHEHCVQAAGKILRIVLSIVLFVSLTPIAMQPRVALAAETASPIVAAQTASAKPVITVKRAATGKVTMPVKGTYKLAASATVGKLTYKSSKPKVASVTKGGVLKAKKAGKTTVTVVAENGKSKATKKVSVTVLKKSKYKKVESLSLKLGSTSLRVGQAIGATVTFNPAKASNKNVVYSSSNPNVATVSTTGVVTAKKTGTAKISVTSCANKEAKETVSVTVDPYIWDDLVPCAGIVKDGNTLVISPESGEIGRFEGLSKLKGIDSSILENVQKIDFEKTVVAGEDCENAFSKVKNLKTINFNGFDTSHVTKMRKMFAGCKFLDAVDLSGLDTSHVTDMCGLFEGCTSLAEADLSGLDTACVEDMGDMFRYCESLVKPNLGGVDTSNVTNLKRMFQGCTSLSAVDVTSFDTRKVKNMSYMFADCSSLQEIDLSSFGTPVVEDVSQMFINCSSLRSIYVSDLWNLSNGVWTSSVYMFLRCKSLAGSAGTSYMNDDGSTGGDGGNMAHIDGGEDDPGYFSYRARPASALNY